jgi:hypothetical protein
VDDQQLQQKLRRFVELREKRDAAKLAATRAESDYREAETEVWEAFDESPQEGSRKIDLGEPYGVVTFQAKETTYGRVLSEEEFLDYLEQSAQVEEYTVAKIKEARINELVRGFREQNIDLPPGLDFRTTRYVSISMPKD